MSDNFLGFLAFVAVTAWSMLYLWLLAVIIIDYYFTRKLKYQTRLISDLQNSKRGNDDVEEDSWTIRRQ